MRKKVIFPMFALLVTGCSDASDHEYTATLYRNSVLSQNIRLHVASYDVSNENNSFNIGNCQMASRLLNANVAAQTPNEKDQPIGSVSYTHLTLPTKA